MYMHVHIVHIHTIVDLFYVCSHFHLPLMLYELFQILMNVPSKSTTVRTAEPVLTHTVDTIALVPLNLQDSSVKTVILEFNFIFMYCTFSFRFFFHFPLTDTDECETGRHMCTDGSTCQNSFGNYTCDCPPGFDGWLCNLGENALIQP